MLLSLPVFQHQRGWLQALLWHLQQQRQQQLAQHSVLGHW
jgi:hypothetical protein